MFNPYGPSANGATGDAARRANFRDSRPTTTGQECDELHRQREIHAQEKRVATIMRREPSIASLKRFRELPWTKLYHYRKKARERTKSNARLNAGDQQTATAAVANNDRRHMGASGLRRDSNNNNNSSSSSSSRPSATPGLRQTNTGSDGIFGSPSSTLSGTMMGDHLLRTNFTSALPTREDNGLWGGHSRIPRPVAGETTTEQRPATGYGRLGVHGRAEVPLRTTTDNRMRAATLSNATAQAFGAGGQSPAAVAEFASLSISNGAQPSRLAKMSANRDDQPRMWDAIRSLSATARANNEGHEPAVYTGLNKVAASLQATMEKVQQQFDTKVAKDMADIREATGHLADSTRAKDRIEALELSVQTKQAQIDKLSQRIVELERQTAAQSISLVEAEDKIAAQSSSLAEKDNELATKEQDIQDLAARCESLQQLL
ncbi:hypothetical protein KC356_g7590 [Hortaea werneckii]|nr:hypothetical protein KC356_g7590 [Hortaea werneckii]